MAGGIDRNAKDVHRLLRNQQRLRGGAATQALNLVVNGGLRLVGTALGLRGFQIVAATPGSPAEGDTWFDSVLKSYRFYKQAATHDMPGILLATGNAGPVASTIVRTSFGSSVVVPANYLIAGRTIRVKAGGVYAAAATPTCQLAIFWNGNGGTTADGATFTMGASGRFYMEQTLTVVTTGAGGTANLGGFITIETSTGAVVQPFGQTGTAINTTITNTIDATAQWSVAAAGNTISLRQMTVETLN